MRGSVCWNSIGMGRWILLPSNAFVLPAGHYSALPGLNFDSQAYVSLEESASTQSRPWGILCGSSGVEVALR